MNTELNIERINFKLTNLNLPIIIIIGPPGAGKTVVGKQLAQSLNWDFYDTDILIEEATSMKVTEIFSKHSEDVFRQLENNLVNEMTKLCQNSTNNSKSKAGTIVSCGGGLPIPPENFANLKKLGQIICLKAPATVLIERMGQIQNRPLLNPNMSGEIATEHTHSKQLSQLEKLLAQRKEVYAKAPYQIDTSNSNIETVVETIRAQLKL